MAVFHIQDQLTDDKLPIYLEDNGDGTYSGDVTPFIVTLLDYSEPPAHIEIGQSVSASWAKGKLYRAIIAFGTAISANKYITTTRAFSFGYGLKTIASHASKWGRFWMVMAHISYGLSTSVSRSKNVTRVSNIIIGMTDNAVKIFGRVRTSSIAFGISPSRIKVVLLPHKNEYVGLYNNPISSPNYVCSSLDDGDTTTVHNHSASAQYDLYGCTKPRFKYGTVYSVTIFARCRKDNALFSASGRTVLKTYNTEYRGTNNSLTENYVLYSTTYVNNPFTGLPWTWDEIFSMQIGTELTGRFELIPPQETKAICTYVCAEIDCDAYMMARSGVGRVSSIAFAIQTEATRRVNYVRRAIMPIALRTRMWLIIPAPGNKSFIFRRIFRVLEFLYNLGKYKIDKM